MNPKEVLAFTKEHRVQFVDLKFVDLYGIWQHFTCPVDQLEEATFEEGLGFDGSSIRGWQAIDASDMIVVPDASTARIDPFVTYGTTMSIIANVFDPITKQPYVRDPRYVAQKAAAYLKSTGIGDTAYFGPEPEFFIFDHISYDSSPNSSFYELDSIEGTWNQGQPNDGTPNLGHRPGFKGGYFPVAPMDAVHPLRMEMVAEMNKVGLKVEREHHEVATGGQCEIDIRFADLVSIADNVMWLKYIVKNVAARHGKTATFMPKPMFGDNGSGMHVHQSIWKDGKPLFAGNEYAGMSKLGLYYIGGILKHASALCALTNPTTNSYKRLVPGFEAPVNLAYSSRNRSAAIRIPMYQSAPATKRIEVRFPDPLANPYLAFSAMLLAGLDGIRNKIDPGEPLDKDIYGLSPEELANVPHVPGSLDGSLDALEKDHEFLLAGDVFDKGLLETWINLKRHHEIDVMAKRPHPLEFELYYNG
jgi:glutamine synthetase